MCILFILVFISISQNIFGINNNKSRNSRAYNPYHPEDDLEDEIQDELFKDGDQSVEMEETKKVVNSDKILKINGKYFNRKQ